MKRTGLSIVPRPDQVSSRGHSLRWTLIEHSRCTYSDTIWPSWFSESEEGTTWLAAISGWTRNLEIT